MEKKLLDQSEKTIWNHKHKKNTFLSVLKKNN